MLCITIKAVNFEWISTFITEVDYLKKFARPEKAQSNQYNSYSSIVIVEYYVSISVISYIA